MPPNPAPSVVITAPGSGATVNLDIAEPLAVTAYAVDMTDGELSANVEWTSNLEGSLGTGASLSLNDTARRNSYHHGEGDGRHQFDRH